MNIYRVTTASGDCYDITSDMVEARDKWLIFFSSKEQHSYGGGRVIAIIDGWEVNNVQLISPETGVADKIKPA
jgi:hypothetical protein